MSYLAKLLPLQNIGKTHLILILVLLFSIFQSNFRLPTSEKRIYEYYSQSLVDDADLNVSNQLPKSERWNLTESYNYPDMHHHGVSILWAPFFYFYKLLPLEKHNTFYSMAAAQLMANTIFSLLLILLSLRLVRGFTGHQSKKLPLMLILMFAFPIFWFTAFEPSNADLTSSCIWALVLTFYLKYIHDQAHTKHFILFGLFTGIHFLIKPQGIMGITLLAHYFIVTTSSFSKRIRLTLSACAVFVAVAALQVAFDYVKLGSPQWGYLGILNFRYYMFFENLFFPSGFIYNIPAFLFAFLALGYLHISKKVGTNQLLFCFILLLIPVAMIAIESFTYVYEETFGGRHWVTFIPSFFYILALYLSKVTNKKLLYFSYGLFALGSLHSISVGLNKLVNYPNFLNSYNYIPSLIQHTGPLHQILTSFSDPLVKVPTAIFICIIIIFRSKIYQISLKSMVGLAIIYVLTLAMLTAKEWIMTSSPSVMAKRSEDFKDSLISTGYHSHFVFENIGTLLKVREYYTISEDPKLELINSVLRNYVEKTKSEFVGGTSQAISVFNDIDQLNDFVDTLRQDPPIY